MRALYLRRQEVLVRAAKRDLGGLLEVEPSPAGLHLLGWLPSGADDRQVARAAARHGVFVTPLSVAYAGSAPRRQGLLLGYACYDEASIDRAVGRLRDALCEASGEADEPCGPIQAS